MTPLLLTSFCPWKAHQSANSSDQLLELMQRQNLLPAGVILLRRLPVHRQLAPMTVMMRMLEVRPAIVVCCGMAERRERLSLERIGKRGDRRLTTPLDLDALIIGTTMTEISTDAGDYVCNDIYYTLLNQVERDRWRACPLFVHVPLLTAANALALSADFQWVINRLWQIAAAQGTPQLYN
ncbi:MAG: peptidase C15 [Cyanobacteria bacterium P01_H01_bin.119]